jgi:ADP-ribose pyrophosphatase YjhB (NUDIX family)
MSRELLAKLTVSVFVLNDQGNLLMVQEKKEKYHGLWGQPGGHIEYGEDPTRAAVREVKQETGYDIRIVSSLATFVFPGVVSKGVQEKPEPYFMNFCFRGELQLHPRSTFDTEEISAVEWFDEKKLRHFDQYRSPLTVIRTGFWLNNRQSQGGIVPLPHRDLRKMTL